MSLNIATLLFALYCLLSSCTVNSINNIYTLYGSSWTQLPGKLKHVTVGPAGVWGVNSNNHIYKLVGANWLKVPGLLKQIDAGGNRFVSGTNHHDSIFCLPTDNTIGYVRSGSDANWVNIPGGLKYYSCGPYSCWGVNNNDQIFVRKVVNSTHCQGSDPWKHIPGSLSKIEVGDDGSVYGVNSAGNVFRRDSTSACTPEGNGWTHIRVHSGQVMHVSYDVGHLWLVLKNCHIYDCTV